MTLSQQECDRIRAEEIVRLQVCKEMKRQRRPQLFLIAIVWAGMLTALVELAYRWPFGK
jgi:hypothetical protein